MLPIITVFKIIAIFYILIRAENAVKFELQSLLKMEEKTKEEQGGSRVGDTMKMAWNVESVNFETRCCSEVKNFEGCYIRMGLRSSSSLRVVAIQAIDIFIRGCYL